MAQSLPPPPVLPGFPTATSIPWLSSSFGTSVPCPLLPSPLALLWPFHPPGIGPPLTSGPWHLLSHLPRRLFPFQITPAPPQPCAPFPAVFKFLYLKCTLHPHLTPSPAAFFSVTLIMTQQATLLVFGLSPHQRDLHWDKNVPVVFPWHLESRRTQAVAHVGDDGAEGCPFRTPLPSGLNVQPPRPPSWLHALSGFHQLRSGCFGSNVSGVVVGNLPWSVLESLQ